MSQAKSIVQVSIAGILDPSFQKTFSAADKQQAQFAQHTGELNKKIGDVGAYRRQQNALKDAATAYNQARAKVAALKAEIEAGGVATRKQAADLARAERAAARAGGAYTQARTKLADMSRELQRSGVNVTKLSSEYRRLQAELARTNTEQAKHERSLRRQQAIVNGMRTAWSAIGKSVAGAVAAGAVLAQPTRKALTYEEQLAYMADTAGAGKSVADRQALQKQLSDAVEGARQYSKGATREDVATALQTIIASGKFGDAEAMSLLPRISRTAFAGNASAEDIAKTAIAMKQFGIRDVGAEFDRILRAGQLGNFEMKDMARYLPQQLALARASGMSGSQGLLDLLAFNQTAMATAGTQDEAGNNVVNLLQKFSSREFSKAIAENVGVKAGDPFTKGKKGQKEFDWAGYSMAQRERGVNPIEAFAQLLERQLAGDKRYQELQGKIRTAGSDGERKATLEAMASIAEGSQLGQIIADRQALMGALAALYGRDKMAELKAGIGSSAGAVDQSAAFLGDQAFAKSKLFGGNLDRANENTFSSVSGPIGAMLDGMNKVSSEFPKLTSAAYGATAALTALAAFGVGGAVFGKLGGGAAAGAGAGGLAGAAGGAAAGGLLSRVGGMSGGRVGMAARLSAPALAAWSGLQAAEAMGLPNTDAEKGKALWDRGEYWKASAYMPAGDFIGAAWGKMTGSDDKVSQAAKAAAAAAVAAAPQPNVTQTFNNSFAVTVNEAKDGKELVPMLQRELDRINRAQAAAARAGYMGQPQH